MPSLLGLHCWKHTAISRAHPFGRRAAVCGCILVHVKAGGFECLLCWIFLEGVTPGGRGSDAALVYFVRRVEYRQMQRERAPNERRCDGKTKWMKT